MSEIDLKEPIFEDDLALSENDQQATKTHNQEFNLFQPSQPLYHQHPPQHSLDSSQRNYRLSQTTTSKRSSPLKYNPKLLKSSENPALPSQEQKSKIDQVKNSFSFLSSISETEHFQCQHKNPICDICKGTGFLRGDSNLIKFFQFVIGFKFGLNNSYKQKRIKSKNKNEVNSFCQQFYNKTEGETKIRNSQPNYYAPSSRHSVEVNSNYHQSEQHNKKQVFASFRSSYKNKLSVKQDLLEQANQIAMIHDNYNCDMCRAEPIIGARYHCVECEDYDMCQKCYHDYSHKHRMEKIEKATRGKQLEIFTTTLVKSHCNFLRRETLQPPPSIKLEMGPVLTTKSAIR